MDEKELLEEMISLIYSIGALKPISRDEIAYISKLAGKLIRESREREKELLEEIKKVESELRELKRRRSKLANTRRELQRILIKLPKKMYYQRRKVRKWALEHFGEVLALFERNASSQEIEVEGDE